MKQKWTRVPISFLPHGKYSCVKHQLYRSVKNMLWKYNALSVMWDIKQKATNKTNKKTSKIQTPVYGDYKRRERLGEVGEGKGNKICGDGKRRLCMVNTMQYMDDILQNYTIEAYKILMSAQ